MKEDLMHTLNVSHSYNKQEVLNDINISVTQGEVVALLGVNGAGKTTLLSILAGIIPPTEGQILIKGSDINNTKQTIRRNIGYLSEDNPLYQNMYVKEYLEFAGRIYLSKKETKEIVDYWIEEVGLQTEYKKKIQSLSKGNKQRVGLAQALIHDPSILILDEPGNGLDPQQQYEMQHILQKLKENKAIIVSTHHILEVSTVATRYLILNDKKIQYDGMPDDATSIENIFYNCTK